MFTLCPPFNAAAAIDNEGMRGTGQPYVCYPLFPFVQVAAVGLRQCSVWLQALFKGIVQLMQGSAWLQTLFKGIVQLMQCSVWLQAV